MAKKFTKKPDARAKSLFCYYNYIIAYCLFAVLVVVTVVVA